MKRRLAVAAALALVTAALFARAGGFAFIDWDDGEYIYDNPEVRAGLSLPGIAWAFTTGHAANWHPLTWLSHMLDVQLFGLDAGAHHLVSVGLHALAAALLLLALADLTSALWRSAFVAALFALHPLHVESVAWVAERKDVLGAVFAFLTLWAYARWTRRGGAGRYALVAAALGLGLLCKPTLVTLPFVLLLLDVWPLARGARIKEKLPLFALAAAASVATVLAQSAEQATTSLEAFPPAARAANAVVSYAVYLGKTVWPARLAFFYPHPASLHEAIPAWQVAAAATLLVVLTVAARRSRSALIGWLWYLGMLVPMIGLVQVGLQARADRYTYLPLIGIFIAIAWLVPRRLAPLAGAALVPLAAATWIQLGTWRDATTLYEHAIAVTDANFFAWNNLGMQRLDDDPARAADCFRRAAAFKPDYADAWYNQGVALAKLGRDSEAIVAYREAVRLDPGNADGWVNLGLVLDATGRHTDAADAFRAALRLRPGDPIASQRLP